MRYDDFLTQLIIAGWLPVHDAQQTGMKKLWASLFPVVAELEGLLQQAENDLLNCANQDRAQQ